MMSRRFTAATMVACAPSNVGSCGHRATRPLVSRSRLDSRDIPACEKMPPADPEATLRLIHKPEVAGTYNLGSGFGHSVNQMRDLVEMVTGLAVKAIGHAARGVDVRSIVLCCTRMESTLGWRPVTGLAQGIANTWQWLQQS